MGKTNIQWTGYTWNPITGCTKISKGCTNCFAERMAVRLAGRYGYPEYPFHFSVTVHEDKIKEPYSWKKPRMVFVNSMSDLFHGDVDTDVIARIFEVMKHTPQHTYQILTKRPERMMILMDTINHPVLENVWLGVSVENQETANRRIPMLLSTKARIRFVSYEPALEYVDFTQYYNRVINAGCCGGCETCGDREEKELPSIDWLIAGCESGPGARWNVSKEELRQVKDQCVGAGVPFFLKQWNYFGKVIKMPYLDGQYWSEMP